MKFLFETHAHTDESSPCGQVDAESIIRLYKENGYSGIIITDHVSRGGVVAQSGIWKESVDNFQKGYYAAKEAGEKYGLTVFYGLEITMASKRSDLLVYGPEPEFLYEHEKIYELSQKELFELVVSEGALLFSAHPFRGYCEPPDPEYLHGIEVFNGNPRHDSRNDVAVIWAEKCGLRKISGSDFHQYEDISSGVYLNTMPEDIKEFVSMIRDGEYETKI